jgi:hypothetical protein
LAYDYDQQLFIKSPRKNAGDGAGYVLAGDGNTGGGR